MFQKNEALFAMLAENEKQHVNSKKESENRSVCCVEGLKKELESYDRLGVGIRLLIRVFYFSFWEHIHLTP